MSEEREALKAVREKLEKETGFYIGSAYGYPKGFDDEAQEFLIVYSNDKNVKFPKIFEGFKVVRRGIPVAL